MRELVPWWGRIGTKLILSRLPAGYAFWRALNMFVHGSMRDPGYALRIFQEHYSQSGLGPGRPFVALELGPGDSLASALIASAFGAQRTYLIDTGAFATRELGVYRALARDLVARGLPTDDLGSVVDLEGLLRVCRASYGTAGLRSLRDVPSASVDFIWSNAVLEHIRRAEFDEFIRELRRVISHHGVCSHQVDLRDHLGGALNNMRFSSRWWERDWMANSGFYTNRMRMSDMLRVFEAAGFNARVTSMLRWPALPTPRGSLAREFQSIKLDELLVSGFSVVLEPA
jgi:SAM-dependent methyltransferase